MLRVGLLPAFLLVVLGPAVSAGAADGPETGARTTVFEMPLPGGLEAALTAIEDAARPDRAQFLLEFIRRVHNAPPSPGDSSPQDLLRNRLIEHLERHGAVTGPPAETIPLPLAPDFWTGTVFNGEARLPTLAIDILRSRGASLLYTGLLSLDDDTRAWLAEHPGLVQAIVTQHPAGFAAAAPGLRVRNGRVLFPGGEAAAPAWSAITGRTAAQPADFVRALLSGENGRLAYLYGSLAIHTPEQIGFALRLEGSEADRAESARRLVRAFDRVGPSWTLETRAFWRPVLDPALLLGELERDAHGRPILQGTRAFWNDVFAGRHANMGGTDRQAPRHWATGQPADFAWIAEQVFREPLDREVRFQSVLFASRVLQGTALSSDAFEAVQAVRAFPALVNALERAGIRSVPTYASAARRARALEHIGRGSARQARTLGQFQGALALFVRAHMRGSLPRADLERLVTALSDLEPGRTGEYHGLVVRFFQRVLEERRRPAPAGMPDRFPDAADFPEILDRELLQVVAGSPASTVSLVEWEGMRYQVDFAHAEALRIERLLGDRQPPALSLATVLLDAADLRVWSPETVRPLVRRFSMLRDLSGLGAAQRPHEWEPGCLRRAEEVLEEGASGKRTTGLADLLRECADDLFARRLGEVAYAVALGNPERIPITAAEAAARHDFGGRRSFAGASRSWQTPARETQAGETWRLTGALLGLDVSLAAFTLVPISSKPPQQRPMLNEQDRRAMTEAIVLMKPASLTDAVRDRLVAALRAGHERLEAARTPEAWRALAEEAQVDAPRRSLLPWVGIHDPRRLPAFLAPVELLRLGLGEDRASGLDAWGAPARARLGCDCLQLPHGRRPEAVAGRWNAGMLASVFPDLNIRLTELLAELGMPAALLAAVLPAATLDFVNGAVSRDPDDRRGPTEFVQALRRETVEQYLALLTIDGPLIPLDEDHAGDDVERLTGGVRP